MVNVNNPEINRNTFTFTSTNNNFESLGTNQYGIHALQSTSIQIEENVFDNSGDILPATSNSTYGVVASNLGENAEEVRNNVFNTLTVGNITQGLNRNIDPNNVTSGRYGLQFLCNTNENNRYDHYVKGTLWSDPNWTGYSSSNYGVANEIGKLNQASGNTLTQLSAPAEDFVNESTPNIGYYWKPSSNSNQHLVQVNGNITFESSWNENACESSFTYNPISEVPEPYISSGMVVSLGNDFNTASQLLQSKSAIYDGLINGGDTEALLLTLNNITSSNNSQIRQNLASLSPFLTEVVIKAVLDYPSSIYPHAWQYDLVIDNIDVVKQYGFVDYLATKNDPLPGWMIQNIENYAASGVVTQKQIKESELSELGSEKAKSANLIIQYYKQDTILVLDSIRQWIANKDEPLGKVRLIDSYLEENNFTAALQEVNALNANINSYPTYLQPELLDLVAFKTFLTNTMVMRGAIADLETVDLNFLNNMADNGIGLASYQARSLLCFFYGDCAERSIDIPLQPKSKKVESTMVVNLETEIKVYPNPAHNYVAIELPIAAENSTIDVFDITGALVYQSNTSKPIFIWDTRNLENGTYIIKVSNISFEPFTQKIVVQH